MVKKIIIALQNADRRAQLVGKLADLPDFRTIATTNCLMTTFAAVEDGAPHGVLISDSLACLPEFEVMRALFETLDVRWLIVRTPGFSTADRYAQGLKSIGSDLFSIDLDMAPSELASAMRVLTRSHQAGLPYPKAAKSHRSKPKRMVLLGASTGGIDALLRVLGNFPTNCPPTLVVQHTGAGFGKSFAQLLARRCAPEVLLVEAPTQLAEGRIILGAGMDRHMILHNQNGLCAIPSHGPSVSGHRPSVDSLFQSALPFARKVVAAVLTGMGRDGAEGLLALRQAGAITFAQDEASSTVFGMPKAAAKIGAAQTVLPLGELSSALLTAAQTPIDHMRRAVQ